LSSDPYFGSGFDGPTAPVYWNLVHGGDSQPPNSWTVPSSAALLADATYVWRVRPRLQATPDGAEERGGDWTLPAAFRVQP
ncbi:MAG: hypothetical protein NTZ05_06380, partial [Chloroflexi bacterium]|nr:hypothetical protein [Chloroflexota bacterium]